MVNTVCLVVPEFPHSAHVCRAVLTEPAAWLCLVLQCGACGDSVWLLYLGLERFEADSFRS